MQAPPIPANEIERLACLHNLQILDTPADAAYDGITALASDLFEVPIALLSIVDRHRQWFKSSVGLEVAETGRDVSFCGHVVASQTPMFVADTRLDERFCGNPLVEGDAAIRFYAGVPLMLEEDICIGTLCIIDRQPREFSAEDLGRLERLRDIAQALLLKEREARVDPLTGVFNRRMFDDTAARLICAAARKGSPLACVCIDIDRFKDVNDTHGHDSGDAVLVEFSRCIDRLTRNSDYLFRLGGEEFALLLPDTNSDQALRLCERLRDALRKLVFYFDTATLTVTASYGVADLAADDDVESLLKRSDEALYAAKDAGRDRALAAEMPGIPSGESQAAADNLFVVAAAQRG